MQNTNSFTVDGKNVSIPERAWRYIAKMPPSIAGSGGHIAAFRVACVLCHGFGLAADEARALFHEWNKLCLPPWSSGELEHKLTSAFNAPSAQSRGYMLQTRERVVLPTGHSVAPTFKTQMPPARPVPDADLIAEVVKSGPSAVKLSLLSPAPLDAEDNGNNCVEIVSALFTDKDSPDPLLCIGKNACLFATRPLSRWVAKKRLSQYSFIVPARMSARTGRTKAGKVSQHTLENTGARRFVVVEFDTGTEDDHAARLWHLDQFSPLVLAVHSGGKSMHGWFPVNNAASADVERFMAYATAIGADRALFRNPSQFVRLPAGRREGGCRQSVFYYAPSELEKTFSVRGEDAPRE